MGGVNIYWISDMCYNVYMLSHFVFTTTLRDSTTLNLLIRKLKFPEIKTVIQLLSGKKQNFKPGL